MYEDMDTTVVDTQTDITPDDAGQGQETQQDDVQGQISDKLREFIGEVEGEQEKANPETVKTEEPPQKEPGWLKMRLMDENRKGDKAGYERAQQEIKSYKNQLAEMQAKLDKYAEMEFEQEAKEIAVKEGCSVDFAKRLLRAERGLKPVQSTPAVDKGQPARDEKGRFVAENTAAEQPQTEEADPVKQQAQMMYDEGMQVKSDTGVDVLKLYLENPEVQRRVLNKQWSFADVAREYLRETGQTQTRTRQTPPPVRSGGASERGTAAVDFMNMTPQQYAAFNKRIDEGYEYRP